MRIIAIVVVCATLTPKFATACNPIFLIRTGTDSEGRPLLRIADSSDNSAVSRVLALARESPAVRDVCVYYGCIQAYQASRELQRRDLSLVQDHSNSANILQTPLYVELTTGNSGAYNDWKGTFALADRSGHSQVLSVPRVVYPLNGDVNRSENRALIEQTLLHEIGHSVMSACFGREQLPNSAYLSKSHSGGSTSDESLAFIEGWAEFVAAHFTGRLTIAKDPADALVTNYYACAGNHPKPCSDLYRTEGWNATVLYMIANETRQSLGLWKMTVVMCEARPQDLKHLLGNLADRYPDTTPLVHSVLAWASASCPPVDVSSRAPFCAISSSCEVIKRDQRKIQAGHHRRRKYVTACEL